MRLCCDTSSGILGAKENEIVHISYFEMLSYCLRSLRWVCDDILQASLVDVPAKNRECVFDDLEILVLCLSVLLDSEAALSRSHVDRHIRDLSRLYLWSFATSGHQFEVILEVRNTALSFCAW